MRFFNILLVGVASVLLFCDALYSQPASSPWPMFRHDVRHTGQSEYAGPSIPQLSWSYITGDNIPSSPAIGSDGVIYVGSYDNNFYVFESNGILNWSYLSAGSLASSPALDSDWRVYIGSGDYNLYVLDSNGALDWSYLTGASVASSPALDSDGTVYVGSYDNNLYVFNSIGAVVWSYLTGNYLYSAPALENDGTVYAGSTDNNIYALKSNGEFNWSYRGNPASGVWSSPAIGSSGNVYIGPALNIYAFSPIGVLNWSYYSGFDLVAYHAVGTDEMIYFGSFGIVFALDSTGSLDWSCSGGGGTRNPPTLGSTGRIYTGSADNNLCSIDADEGSVWSYKIAGRLLYSSPALGSDGRLYVGSEDNALYCIKQVPPPWPMFQYNAKHMGRSPYRGPSTGGLYWSYNFSSGPEGGHVQVAPSIGPDGRIYTAEDGAGHPQWCEWHHMYCMNPDGTMVWSYASAAWSYWDEEAEEMFYVSSFMDSQPVLDSQCNVYYGEAAGDTHSRFYSLSSAGVLRWSYRPADSIWSSSVMGPNGELYFGTHTHRGSGLDKNLYMLDSNGLLKWSYNTAGGTRSAPAIAGDGSVAHKADRLFLLDSSGTLTWSYSVGSQLQALSFGDGGAIYSGSGDGDGNVYALNADGALFWSYKLGVSYDPENPDWWRYVDVVTADEEGGRVYTGWLVASDSDWKVQDDRLYALTSLGAFCWSYDCAVGGDWAPMGDIVLDSDRRIYNMNPDGKLYAINSDGGLFWSYGIGYYVQSGPAIGSNGKIYLNDSNGRLWAVGTTP